MSDYYDGYREGMAQASRETAVLREQLDALIESIVDLKSLTMPPPLIRITVPATRKPMTEDEMRKAWGDPEVLTKQCLIDYCRAIEKHHGILGGSNE